MRAQILLIIVIGILLRKAMLRSVSCKLISSAAVVSGRRGPSTLKAFTAPYKELQLHPARQLTPQPHRAGTLSQTRLYRTSAIMAESMRTESDAFGEIQVPSDRYWGAQTERSLENFKINQPQDRMPPPIVRAFGILKGAAATVNMKFGLGQSFYHNS